MAFVLLHSPHNVSNPDVAFSAPTTTTTPKKVVVDNFVWPRYGYDAERTHFLPGSGVPEPPLHVGWTFQDYALLEFPPVIYANDLYVMDDDGSAKELDKRTGHKLWETKAGTLAAASPALGVAQGLMYLSVLSVHGHSPGNGAFVALSMKTGRVAWSKPIPAGTESSPIAFGKSVYFGDQSGTVYSLDATTGHVNWTFHASGPVKGGPALSDGVLYFGDYSGRAYAVNAATGHQVWASNTNGADFGFGSGNFYSTPAVAFGRVYMGNTDGRVYSFAAKTGQLAWATGTGAYVYASAAVDRHAGARPDDLPRVLRRQLLRVQRPHRRDQVEASRRGQDLRLGDDRRQRRLLLRPRHEDHRRARRAHRPEGFLVPRRRIQPGRRRRSRDLPEWVHAPVPDAPESLT